MDDQTNAALRIENIFTLDASARRKAAFQHALLTSLSLEVPHQLSHRLLASIAVRQHFPGLCCGPTPAALSTVCTRPGATYPEELPGQAEHPPDFPGPGGARAVWPGRRGHRGQAGPPPTDTRHTSLSNCLKGLEAGDAAGRGMGVGAKQAPGKTLRGCGPGSGKGRRLPGVLTPRRQDFLLWEPALRPAEGP